jgi:RepB DNA-primase from phage plasmid
MLKRDLDSASHHIPQTGAHIYIPPAGTHSSSLIGDLDLTADAIERMRAEGFEPAVVVETSPNDFQA